jgi:hypothetical protein
MAEKGNTVIPERLIMIFQNIAFRFYETYLQGRQ